MIIASMYAGTTNRSPLIEQRIPAASTPSGLVSYAPQLIIFYRSEKSSCTTVPRQLVPSSVLILSPGCSPLLNTE